MIYNTGTLSVNGNTATGTGTNWTALASQIRLGQTLVVLSNPVQLFQITAINSATSLTVTPAASPTLTGQKYGILVTDAMSVDGLAQSISQLINQYDENIGAWETFATTSANQDITVTINGKAVTIPAIGGLARKGSNSDITELKGLTTALSIDQGGTGAKNADDARIKMGLGSAAVLAANTSVQGSSGWFKDTATGWMVQKGYINVSANSNRNVTLPVSFSQVGTCIVVCTIRSTGSSFTTSGEIFGMMQSAGTVNISNTHSLALDINYIIIGW